MQNSNVAHNWAHATGSMKNGSSFYYDDRGVVYSYGNHFPISKRVDSSTFLFTLRKYGNSTAKHIRKAINAIPLGANIIYMDQIPVYDDLPSHGINFKYWIDLLNTNLGLLSKARNKTKYINIISDIVAQVINYARHYNCNTDICESYRPLYDIVRQWENTPINTIVGLEADRLNALQEKKFASALKDYEVNVIKFRNFEVNEVSLPYQIASNKTLGYTQLLRYDISKDVFHTSLGVDIPSAIALRFYNDCIVNICNDCTKLLHYEVMQITDKFIAIGCHKITIEEIHNVVGMYNQAQTTLHKVARL